MEIRESSANVKQFAKTESSGFMTDTLLSAGVVTLAILGLVGILPFYMVTIATIAMGVILLVQNSVIGASFSQVARDRAEKAGAGAGITSETIGGVGGVVLGILALLGIFPAILIPVAIIAFGASLVLSAGIPSQMNTWVDESSTEGESSRKMSKVSAGGISGLQFLVGLGGITLGILGLLGYSPFFLSLIALIGLGGSELISNGFLGARTGQLSAAKVRY